MTEFVEICSLIAGGFVAAGTQCVVVLKTTTTEMIPVVSKTPSQSPEILFDLLSKHIHTTDVTITVFCLCGGFDGTLIQQDRQCQTTTLLH